MSADKATLEALGLVVREMFDKLRDEMRSELRRADRSHELRLTIDELGIEETLRDLRSFVHVAAYEKSRLIEERGGSPPWLTSLDSERMP
ncbi:hypothetical protein DSM104443_01161 [Usitatibacter rugosus]|uniref:Uncharacterized protein n=1 Tax=Usitatibacter rugosus TaxID=2732067 RepID=A0A6M4GTC1_9PROT|nr:hypothetical protein [Usitatibacter rugosus]QJR10108.1 hypothetical protein DSM104443_01161 [Usitatibacter rugosus]